MTGRAKTGLGIASLGCVLAAACSQSDVDAVAQTQCVDIPDGYYLFTDGKFSPTSADLAIEAAPEVTQHTVAWSHDIESQLEDAGFGWFNLNVSGPVATFVGTAPNADTKQAAFEAGEAAIEADRQARAAIRIIVDGIAIEGVERGVGAAVADLTDSPTPEACQSAFETVMAGQSVEFSSDNASILPSSGKLLDAATGAAFLCNDYKIEIGGHTDARGADSYNLRLSQQRADTVRTYLIDKGVSGEKLTAVGYGETRPLDREQTTEAYARNRRTEFNVLPN